MRTTRWLAMTAVALVVLGAALLTGRVGIDRPPEEERLAPPVPSASIE